jgi:segregation and condensation protein B
MSNSELERSIEAILMVVDEPVTELTLASVLEVTVDEVVSALERLSGSYEERGFALKAINGGWRFYSHPDFHVAVEKFVLSPAGFSSPSLSHSRRKCGGGHENPHL